MPNSTVTLPQWQIEIEQLMRLRARLLPPYKVVLFDDDYHEMDYVVSVLLHTVNKLTPAEAERIMLTTHLTGSAVVTICPKETAEHYQDKLSGFGLRTTIEQED
ncbi:MAG TPA: ATP-dependent Clp protease adaptor ClpS [Ktedonobacteraceae bacterium]|nr:ATP-dependent Clp protease adaptor ClpS [Ktedonobacteraceae bacterium]